MELKAKAVKILYFALIILFVAYEIFIVMLFRVSISNTQVYENLSDNYSINAASNEDKYATVILRGVESVLDEITEDDIKVYVDLKGYGPGTHDIDVIVSGDDVRVSYEAKVKKVTLIISQKR